MSWVTDVLLIFSLGELFDEDGEELESIAALNNINTWLQECGKGVLDNLDQHIISGGKPMGACVYGGAFNFLKIDDFISVVEKQPWRERECVQLLIQDEEEERFTMYTFSNEQNH